MYQILENVLGSNAFPSFVQPGKELSCHYLQLTALEKQPETT